MIFSLILSFGYLIFWLPPSSYIKTFFSDLAHYSSRKVLEKKQHVENKSTGISKVFILQKDPLHVGNNDKPNYPVAKDAGLIEYEYTFSLKQQPQKADLIVESYDVDTIGGKIFINDHHVGDFSVGDPWHTDTFHVPVKVFKIGVNVIKVKTNILKTGKMEDFLFRNLKLFVEY